MGVATTPSVTVVPGLGTVPAVLWSLIAAAAVVSVPTTFRLLDPAAVGTDLLGGVDPYVAWAVLSHVSGFEGRSCPCSG